MSPEDEEELKFLLRSVQRRQRQIGIELGRLWEGVLSEPIPEEMLELLRKLDERNGGEPNA